MNEPYEGDRSGQAVGANVQPEAARADAPRARRRPLGRAHRGALAALGLFAVVAIVASLVVRDAFLTAPSGSKEPGGNLTYACAGAGESALFNLDDLLGPDGAERGTDGAAEALRAAIQAPPSEAVKLRGGLPISGWRRVYSGEGKAIFLGQGSPQADLFTVTATRSGSTWSTSIVVGCQLMAFDGPHTGDTWYTGSSWHLAQEPTPESTVLHVVVNGESSCGTLIGPTVAYRSDKVVVVFWWQEKPSCDMEGNWLSADIRLTEPLGNRPLYDGASFPMLIARVDNVKPSGTWTP